MSSELLRKYDALNSDVYGTIEAIDSLKEQISCTITMSDLKGALQSLERLTRSLVIAELQRDRTRRELVRHLDSAIFLIDDTDSETFHASLAEAIDNDGQEL